MRATIKPTVTTSDCATLPPRRLRIRTRSINAPMSGAKTNTTTTNESSVGQP
jgi:hypothetical protein